MAKNNSTAKPGDAEKVSLYMEALDHPLKQGVEVLRSIIKKANPKHNERIKSNAPSYYYIDDIVTFGPLRSEKVLLVFHHPFVVKVASKLLEGDYKDRRLIYFESMKDIIDNKKELVRIIMELAALVK